jgi:hypothetical protein
MLFLRKEGVYDGIISNATMMLGTSSRRAIVGGSIPVQQKDSSWSKRIRGRVARNQTNPKQPAHVLRASTIALSEITVPFATSSGAAQPPRNSVADSALIRTIEQYSRFIIGC